MTGGVTMAVHILATCCNAIVFTYINAIKITFNDTKILIGGHFGIS